MADQHPPQAQLMAELAALRQRVRELESACMDSPHTDRLCQAIVEDLPLLICRFLPDGTLTFVNEAYCRYFGKSRAELIGHSFAPLSPPEDQAYVRAQLDTLNPTQPTITYEHRVIAPDGTLRWQRWIDRAVFDGAQLVEFQSIGEDITERKWIEARYYRLFTEAPLMDVITRNTAGGPIISDCNQAFLSSLGYTREEVLGQPLADFYAPASRAALLEQHGYQRALAGQFTTEERTLLARDGRRIQAMLTAVQDVDPYGNVIGTRAMFVDITARTQAEAQLQQLEQDYRTLAENSPDLIARFDPHLRHVYVNPAAARAGRLSPTAYVGLTIEETGVPAQTAVIWEERLRQVLATQQMVDIVDVFDTPQGPRYFHTRLVPELTAAGQVGSILSIARDITERKQAEIAQRESEERYRLLVESSPYAIGVYQDGRLIFANPAAVCLFGAANAAELVGRTLDQLVAPQALPEVQQRIARMLAGETGLYPAEVLYRRLDGRLVQVEVTAAPFVHDKRPAVQIMVLDLTERKQVEAAWHESEERYRQLFDSSLDAVLLTSPDGHILAANPAACRMFERTEDALKQVGRGGVVDVTDPRLAAALAKRARTGHFSGELMLVRGDGTPFPGEVTTSLFSDLAGQPRTSMIIRDITERKRAEAQLKKSEEALQSTLDGLAAHIANLDERGNILVVNAAWKQFAILNGLAADDYGRGQNYLDICDQATGECAAEATAMAAGIREVLAGRLDNFYLEYPCHSPTEQRWFAVRVTPFVGTGPARVVVAHDNITVRVLAEQALRRRVIELTAVHRAGQRLQNVLSLDALAAETMTVLEHILGYDFGAILLIDEATGQLLPFALHAEGGDAAFLKADRAYVISHDIRVGVGVTGWVAQTGQSLRLNDVRQDPRYVSLRQDIGSELCVPLRIGEQTIGMINVESTQLAAYTEDDQRVLETVAAQVAGAIHNARLFEQVQHYATEMEDHVRQRTAELAHERERLRAILDAAGDGMLFTNVAGNIEYINPAMERLTGYTAAEALGHNPHIWQSGQTPRAVYERMWGAITGGETWRGELINRRHDGSLYDAALTVAPLQDTERRVFGFVGALRDITQQKELDRLKDQFVANVSHELRTPLTSIMLNLDLLDRGKPEKHPSYLATLRREAERLKIMIEDLLDISRLDRQTIPIDLAPLDLHQLAEQIVSDRAGVAVERGLSLEFLPSVAVAQVMAEASMLTQVISNLIANALNYTPAGGSVTVQTHRQRAATQDWLTLTVRDTGPGISTRDLPHIFERFYRGEVGRKATAPGTGLGLAISKTIMEQLGGRITVESEPGQGTAFTLWLRPA